jgi:hypothetical protein
MKYLITTVKEKRRKNGKNIRGKGFKEGFQEKRW